MPCNKAGIFNTKEHYQLGNVCFPKHAISKRFPSSQMSVIMTEGTRKKQFDSFSFHGFLWG